MALSRERRALTANVWVVGTGFLVSGAATMVWNITNVSLRQSIVPSRLLGRVHGTHRFMATSAGLVGAVTAGAAGELIGLRAVFAIAAGVVALGFVGRRVVTEARIAAVEGSPDAVPANP